MDQTTHLSLPYILAAQSQKHVTHNEALRALDAIVQLAVADKDLGTPPGSPAEGDRYIVAAGASGAWSGHAGHVAAYQDGAWAFYAPASGWRAWVLDEETLYVFGGEAWEATASGGSGGGGIGSVNPVSLVGVNAVADTTNRLKVSSPAALFDHEGNDHRLKINKHAQADTASVLFQTGYSGRAEFGLAGDDDFHVKVSADGSAWTEALVINRTSGGVRVKAAQVDVASAATCNIGAAAAQRVRITGTTAITSLGTVANELRFVTFAGALTLTHNATSLILPGAANIATAAGDTAILASDASGTWRCLSYQRAASAAGGGGSEGPEGPQGPEGPPGATGPKGDAGDEGASGWSPVLSLASDGARRVLEVIDWQGGEDAKPAAGLYVGATGLVGDIADGADVRGSQGASGARGDGGPQGDAGPQGVAGASYAGTSPSEITIATGSLVFTTEAGLAFQAGARARATATANLAKWVDGIVTAYSGTSLTILASKVSGTGETFDDWAINLSGEPGLDGEGAGTVNTAGDGLELVSAGSALRLTDTGVTPGTYGSGGSIPVVTVDGKGRITGLSETAVAASAGSDQLLTSVAMNAMMLAGSIGFAQFPSADSFADSFNDPTYVDVAGATGLNTATAGVLCPALSSTSLLHFNGSNGSTTLTDVGSGAWAWSCFGSAALSTSVKKFGSAALTLPGSGSYIKTVTPTTLGSGAWSIRGQFYFSSLPTSGQRMQLIRVVTSLGSSASIGLWLDNTGGTIKPFWGLSSNGSSYNIRTPAVGNKSSWSTATWYHWELTFDGSTYRLFIDGTLDSSTSSATTVAGSLSAIWVGADDLSGSLLRGGVDELAITIGTATHTANFTPPVAEYALYSDLTVATSALPLVNQPDVMSGFFLVREVDSVTANTDLGVRFTRDNGAHWEDATLTLVRTVPIAGGVTLKLYATGDVDMTGHAFATAAKAQLWTANNKSVEFHGLYVRGAS